MISQLTGKILIKQPPTIILDVGGVGYEVAAPMSTFYALPEVGQQACLLTHFIVREDAQLLYGFASVRERALFRAVIKVNGVGPKIALAVLSGIAPDNFIHCVATGDTATLIKIPGIGKAMADRLVVELRRRLKDLPQGGQVAQSAVVSAPNPTSTLMSDATDALIALGYKPPIAERMLLRVKEKVDNCETLIRLALQQQGA